MNGKHPFCALWKLSTLLEMKQWSNSSFAFECSHTIVKTVSSVRSLWVHIKKGLAAVKLSCVEFLRSSLTVSFGIVSKLRLQLPVVSSRGTCLVSRLS